MISLPILGFSLLHFGLASALYRWFISKHPNVQIQRSLLMLFSVTALIVPFISWNSVEVVSQLSGVIVTVGREAIAINPKEYSIGFSKLMLMFYGIGAVFMAIKLLIQYLSALSLILRFPVIRKEGGLTIRETLNAYPSFSFWNQICLNEKDVQSFEIIAHERVHANEWHSLDRLLMDVLKIAFWFNPFVYYISRQMELIHEFIADENVIKSTEKPSDYAELIVQSVTGMILQIPVKTFAVQHSLQKRIQFILNKNLQQNPKYMKYTPVLSALVLSASILLAACTEQTVGFDENPDVQPQFGVKTQTTLGKEIGKFLVYPETARKDSAEGKVILQFLVQRDGQLGNVEVIKSSGRTDLDTEALKVGKSLVDWQPATKNGEAVNAKYTMPIVFRLSEK